MKSRHERKEAIALGYDQQDGSAPKVVAKGKGMIAENILLKAGEHGVPVQEDKSLLSLLGNLDIGESIPEELYGAVAEVFAFIYRLDRDISKKE
ncbi:EscU/YscU/HrcU family type III secretion system export apparatus switch protein [Rossellomorea vietnamensis]|uniref:EscU/YscU/HrcU family type III secretion system export apparatus switch protein n=1 Tax=Rossellomorea vietnamensis TaxID=218284 RepID=A0ACD4CAW4_9BACI|nr:EscU/YscU/HrcU family type III secretion system export apparatus switch protein [Rossellomorea vietnamensis]UXH45431.1 EscU/YscU/HrcU family type III secretion system export apparatus switch protein [Rossellomorea vietnamensis]WQI96787.1 EscU/YscU/HrcU family type III secretion system export apparatus switch protein [Rossellomorea vietnamensis]